MLIDIIVGGSLKGKQRQNIVLVKCTPWWTKSHRRQVYETASALRKAVALLPCCLLSFNRSKLDEPGGSDVWGGILYES